MRLASLVACLFCALHGKAGAALELPHTLAVPGGVAAAAQVMGDARDVAPAWFAYDLVLRFYNQPADAVHSHDPSLRRLLDWFATQRDATPAARDTPGVPSPLSAGAWRTVLGVSDPSHQDPDLGHVLASHDAALLYVALLRMSPATRTALVTDPARLRTLLPHASALAIVAPVLERDEVGWLLPGGVGARPIWARLTGRAPDDPRFLQALLTRDQGWVCVLADVVGLLSEDQQRAALGLRTPAEPYAARLLRALRLASPDWQPLQRPFWRPTLDPALLLLQLPADRDGLRLPGSARAWSAMLSDGRLHPRATDDTPQSPTAPPSRVTPAWLVEQVFRGAMATRRRAYDQVLFAQRLLGASTTLPAATAAVIHAAGTHPQLVLTLERLGLREPRTYLRVVEWVRALDTSGTTSRLTSRPMSRATSRPVATLQAALMLLVHARAGGRLDADDVDAAVNALVEALRAGEANLAPWLRVVTGHEGPDLDTAVIRFAAGVGPAAPIHWEGTTYVIDPGAAAVARIARLRGAAPMATRDAASTAGVSATDWLVELTYALAMGWGDELPLRPSEAAARHAFGRSAADESQAWDAPVLAVDEGTRWYVRGSLLGLDVALAPLTLRRASTRIPLRRPSLNTADRRVLIESIALVRRTDLDATRARDSHDALTAGQARIVDALGDEARCLALVERLPLGHARASLLAWTCRHDAARLPRALSVREVMRLGGISPAPIAHVSSMSTADAHYGALAQPLSGAWGLWLSPLVDPERLGGHWGTGVAAALFADLHVRVLGLLGELDLPAALLPEALAGVTWEFVTHVPAAYPDDWHAMNEMVWRLDVEAVERALALHTGDGVLRVVDLP